MAQADSLNDRHAFREMEALASGQLARALAAHGDSSLEAAEWFLQRALARSALARPAEAQIDLEKCIGIRTARLGRDDPGLIDPIAELGSVSIARGRYAEADSLYARALGIVQQGSPVDSLELAAVLVGQGSQRMATGRFREAISLTEWAIAIGERHPGARPPDIAFWYDRLGVALTRGGKEAQGEAAHRHALGIIERLFGPEDLLTGVTCSNLGMALMELGDAPGARHYMERALAITTRAQGPRSISAGRIEYNIAVTAYGAGDYGGALAHILEAKSILEESQGPGSVEMRGVLSLLGQLEDRMGKTEEAERHLREAYEIALEKLGPDHSLTAVNASALGSFLIIHRRPDEALTLVETFTDRMASRHGASHRHTIRLRANLAWALLQTDRAREGWRQAYSACVAATSAFGDVFGTASERRALLYADRFRKPLDILISAAVADPELTRGMLDSTFTMVALSRGRVLDYLVDRGWIAHASTTDPLARAVAQARADLADLVIRGRGGSSSEAYQQNLDKTRWEKEATEAALVRSGPSFLRWRSVRGSLELTDLARIASELPEGSATIQYVRYGDWSRRQSPGTGRRTYRDLAFVLSRDAGGKALVRFTPLCESVLLDSLVHAYREEIARTDGTDPAAVRSTAQALYNVVWAPIEPLVQSTRLLLILPDGPLHFVDFATLMLPDGRFLIEAHRLHRLTSLRDLIRLSDETTQTMEGRKQALAVADPEFDLRSRTIRAGADDGHRDVSLQSGRPRVGRLPGTAQEIERLKFLLARDAGWQIQDLTGSAASEENVKRGAPGCRVVHLATHGFFIGAPVEGREGAETAADLPDFVRREDPLLLSGILLAGCNEATAAESGDFHKADDGWLTAEEIALCDLREADWVVLSACDTGLGETDPQEGVLGLQRAIELAGARTSVLTLWKIPDTTMPDLIGDLYARRLAGESTVDALRGAELAALKRAREDLLSDHPRYWAGIVATGDWR